LGGQHWDYSILFNGFPSFQPFKKAIKNSAPDPAKFRKNPEKDRRYF